MPLRGSLLTQIDAFRPPTSLTSAQMTVKVAREGRATYAKAPWYWIRARGTYARRLLYEICAKRILLAYSSHLRYVKEVNFKDFTRFQMRNVELIWTIPNIVHRNFNQNRNKNFLKMKVTQSGSNWKKKCYLIINIIKENKNDNIH